MTDIERRKTLYHHHNCKPSYCHSQQHKSTKNG